MSRNRIADVGIKVNTIACSTFPVFFHLEAQNFIFLTTVEQKWGERKMKRCEMSRPISSLAKTFLAQNHQRCSVSSVRTGGGVQKMSKAETKKDLKSIFFLTFLKYGIQSSHKHCFL
jgi:hypothetical protein